MIMMMMMIGESDSRPLLHFLDGPLGVRRVVFSQIIVP
jgi:hypothetical protein